MPSLTSKSLRLAATAGMILASISEPLRAAGLESAEEFEKLFFMDMPVVTASKFRQTVASAPSNITVIGEEEIRNLGARDLQDVLNLVPGVEMNRGTVFSVHHNVSMRGRVGEFGEDVLFLLDGQRLNDAQSGGGLLYLRSLPVHNIRKIEVIRGPGSSLYGSNAFSGVVNVITHDPLIPGASKAAFAGGGLSAGDGHVNLSRRFGGATLGLSARGTTDKGDKYKIKQGLNMAPGQVQTVEDSVDSAYDLGLRLSWGGLSLESDYAERELRGFILAGIVDNAWTSSVLSEQEDSSRFFRTQAKYEWKVNDRLSLIPALRYTQGDLRFISFAIPPGVIPAFVSPGLNAQGLIGGPDHNTQNYEAELQVNYALEKHQVVGGVLYQREDVTSIASVFNVNPNDGRGRAHGIPLVGMGIVSGDGSCGGRGRRGPGLAV